MPKEPWNELKSQIREAWRGKLGLPGMWISMSIELCVRGLLMLCRQKTSRYDQLGNAKRP